MKDEDDSLHYFPKLRGHYGFAACVVLREPGGAAARPRAGVAAHAGPVAGDRGEDGAAGAEDELPGAAAPRHQPHPVTTTTTHSTRTLINKHNVQYNLRRPRRV